MVMLLMLLLKYLVWNSPLDLQLLVAITTANDNDHLKNEFN